MRKPSQKTQICLALAVPRKRTVSSPTPNRSPDQYAYVIEHIRIARSRLALSVSFFGAIRSSRAWKSPSAGVWPSFKLARGRLAPLTGLTGTAFFSHRYSKRLDSAAILPRIVEPESSRSLRLLRQGSTWPSVTIRNSTGFSTMPVNAIKSAISARYARLLIRHAE